MAARPGSDRVARFETVDAAVLYAPVAAWMPSGLARVLDIGAGTGRDAAWFATAGHDVWAVEPDDRLRGAAEQLHGQAAVWIKGALPEVAGVAGRFDLVVMSAVWHLIAPQDHAAAWRRVFDLVAEGGRVVMSLRHDPRGGAPQDMVAVVRQGAEAAGFLRRAEIAAPSQQPGNAARGVHWTWCVFER